MRRRRHAAVAGIAVICGLLVVIALSKNPMGTEGLEPSTTEAADAAADAKLAREAHDGAGRSALAPVPQGAPPAIESSTGSDGDGGGQELAPHGENLAAILDLVREEYEKASPRSRPNAARVMLQVSLAAVLDSLGQSVPTGSPGSGAKFDQAGVPFQFSLNQRAYHFWAGEYPEFDQVKLACQEGGPLPEDLEVQILNRYGEALSCLPRL